MKSERKHVQRQWGSPELPLAEGEERRRYFRIPFIYPLEAVMTVSELNGKKITVSKAGVLIDNIGPGGLCFISNIQLPVEADIVLNFEVEIFGEVHSLYGSIVHHHQKDELLYYGVKFRMRETQRNKYISLFNNLQLKMKSNPVLSEHAFYLGNVYSFFKDR